MNLLTLQAQAVNFLNLLIIGLKVNILLNYISLLWLYTYDCGGFLGFIFKLNFLQKSTFD